MNTPRITYSANAYDPADKQPAHPDYDPDCRYWVGITVDYGDGASVEVLAEGLETAKDARTAAESHSGVPLAWQPSYEGLSTSPLEYAVA